MTKPFRITFTSVIVTPEEDQLSYIAHNQKKQQITEVPTSNKKLAVVAGGYSTLTHLEEIRNFDGDIWSINATGKWLSDRGISSTVLCIDSATEYLPNADLITGALFSTRVPISLTEQFPDALFFDLANDREGGIPGGTTAAGRTPVLAATLGYKEIHYYGCEGSFEPDKTHVDRNETQYPDYLMVKVGNEYFNSRSDLLVQCEEMSGLMKQLPKVLINHSGGLLQAMIDDNDTWSIYAVSKELLANMKPIKGSEYD